MDILLYYLHGFLLPFWQYNYNSKLYKILVMNIWLFVLIHSLREMLNVHQQNMKIEFSFSNLLSITFSLLFVLLTSFFNYYIFIRKEHNFLNDVLTTVKQRFEFFSSFLLTFLFYGVLYIYMDPKVINRLYNSLNVLLLTGLLFYFIVNFRYLGRERTLVSNSDFSRISRLCILASFLFVVGLVFLHFYYHLPIFVILFSCFLIFNFQLYKYLNNGIMIFPYYGKIAFRYSSKNIGL